MAVEDIVGVAEADISVKEIVVKRPMEMRIHPKMKDVMLIKEILKGEKKAADGAGPHAHEDTEEESGKRFHTNPSKISWKFLISCFILTRHSINQL